MVRMIEAVEILIILFWHLICVLGKLYNTNGCCSCCWCPSVVAGVAPLRVRQWLCCGWVPRVVTTSLQELRRPPPQPPPSPPASPCLGATHRNISNKHWSIMQVCRHEKLQSRVCLWLDKMYYIFTPSHLTNSLPMFNSPSTFHIHRDKFHEVWL